MCLLCGGQFTRAWGKLYYEDKEHSLVAPLAKVAAGPLADCTEDAPKLFSNGGFRLDRNRGLGVGSGLRRPLDVFPRLSWSKTTKAQP